MPILESLNGNTVFNLDTGTLVMKNCTVTSGENK